MKTTVDGRGQACPQPVVLTLKAMGQAEEVTTIVDNQAAVENVTRLASSRGWSVAVVAQKDGTYLHLTKPGGHATEIPAIERAPEPAPATGSLVLFVPSNCLGRGADELGERLMGAFFHTLVEVSPKPSTIVLMNSGVKLVAQGSRAIEDLQALAMQGIDILACGTCLGYFELTDKLAVGRVSNMHEIATVLMEAGRIVEL